MTEDVEELLTRRHAALGEVIEYSALMEWTLREAFCSLVGSRFAKVVAGGQPVVWLIETCTALADAHEEIPDIARKAIKDALTACRAANERRNHLVHGVKSMILTPDGSMHTIKNRRRSDIPIKQDWTLPGIQAVNHELILANTMLHIAIENALPRDQVFVDGGFTWLDDGGTSHR
jgi:hypothetical protein